MMVCVLAEMTWMSVGRGPGEEGLNSLPGRGVGEQREREGQRTQEPKKRWERYGTCNAFGDGTGHHWELSSVGRERVRSEPVVTVHHVLVHACSLSKGR